MSRERPITLADVRRASSVYVRLPVDPYWRDEDEVPDQEAEVYPPLESNPDMPYPSLVRITKAVAAELVCGHQSSARRRIVGNIFDPFFFSPRWTGRNLYILRLHIDLPGNPRKFDERPIELDDVRRASNVYVRLRMSESGSSQVAQQLRRSLRLSSRSLVARTTKTEAERIVRDLDGFDYWSVLGTTNDARDGCVLQIDRVGVDY